MKKVSVVILHYKHSEDTLKCINSVLKSTYPEISIILINNSDEDLRQYVKKNIEYIQTGKNLGYTGGNNIGIQKALENGSDFIFILNPDTTIKKNAIEVLVKEVGEFEGVFGPKIYFKDEKTIWYAGGILDTDNVIGHHRGVDEKDLGQYDKREETDFVTGAAFFVTRKVFDNIGIFDERYFLYMEDVDFCMRAKKTKYKIMYIPNSLIYHENAKSTGLGSPLQDYYITRNRMLFALKFLPFRTQFALFRESLRNLGNPIKRQGFLDFLLGNFGKGSFKID